MPDDPIDVTADPTKLRVPKKLKRHVRAINKAYEGIHARFYETELECAHACRELEEKDKADMLKYLRFPASKSSEFAALGKKFPLVKPVRSQDDDQ